MKLHKGTIRGPFAMRVLRKHLLRSSARQEHILREKHNLTDARCPFIVRWVAVDQSLLVSEGGHDLVAASTTRNDGTRLVFVIIRMHDMGCLTVCLLLCCAKTALYLQRSSVCVHADRGLSGRRAMESATRQVLKIVSALLFLELKRKTNVNVFPSSGR